MSGQPAVLQVVILRDGLLVGTQVFVPGSFVLGSAPHADLQLDDPTVDPEHALLYFQNGKAAVQDSGSSTGLFVNGHQVTACEIRAVDEVVVGPFVLKTRVLAQRKSNPQHAPPEVAALLQDQQRMAEAGPRLGQPIPPQGGRAAAPPARGPALVAPRNTPVDATVPSARRKVGPGASPQGRAGPAMQELAMLELPTAPGPVARPQLHGVTGGLAYDRPSPAQSMPDPFAWPADEATQLPDEQTRTHSPVGAALESWEGSAQALPTDPGPSTNRIAARPGPHSKGKQEAVRPATARGATPPTPGVRVDRLGKSKVKRTWLPPPPAEPQLFSIPKKGGRGAARLYFELYWKEARQTAVSFGPDKKKPIIAGGDKPRSFELNGFSLPKEGFALAESVPGDGYRVFIPPRAQAERRRTDGSWTVCAGKELEQSGGRRCVTVGLGTALRLIEGDMQLFAYVAPRPERVFVNPLKGLPWLTMLLVAGFSYGFGYYMLFGPRPPELPDFAAKNLNPVAVRLLAPEKKKEKPPPPKVEPLKDDKPKEVAKKVEKPQPRRLVAAPKPKAEPKPAVPPPVENKALKALAKLSAAGPAMKDMLAAVDKMGSGPGNKNIKDTNFKLANMIGKAPIANAGLGSFGLGGLGKGGGATLGSELLHGRGGGGIGALGAGNVGKGHVGGVVTQASARTVSSQGNIDREAVARAINSHLQEVRGCYERALSTNPGLAGKVMLEWTISTTGKVVTIKTKSSSLRDGSVEGCILQSLKTWQFPPARGGVVIVSYPFLFNSVGF